MTGSRPNTDGPGTRPISVAELLAKNGTIGAPPVTGHRRRRRGNSDAVTVAELTGEIPVVVDEDHPPEPDRPATSEQRPDGATQVAEPVPDEAEEDRGKTPHWSEPEPRSGAEGMRPDPLDDYADISVDVMDTDVREAEPATEDSPYVRSYLGAAPPDERAESESEAPAEGQEFDEDYLDFDQEDLDEHAERDVDESSAWSSKPEMLLHGGVVVLQSILAVAFGAGLFIAFDQLWQWNNIVALVLAVLVILGLVAGVQVVRKTVDTASTLIAVAVGALIAFGPLALLQSG